MSTDISSSTGEGVSQDTKMDEMIERASIPNLASLFKKGKDSGLLKPQQDYASN